MRMPFELDPQIIHHIIYSQAGSIGKAIIELLMNAVDAKATAVCLTMTKEGFKCSDDGHGFASFDDVLRYFGRFGTPHQEGDATYGRFRLGRGQIIAHASTKWISNRWAMTVDTRLMGYNYDLDDVPQAIAGCSITGTWYEPLNGLELMSAAQEIRDLVRYTSISVELNGRVITRDPAQEKWDFEDEWAYYRAKEQGPVSLYNQGVLIRHDSSHMWGGGGLIVSKQAIGLNVSRTEILRKTCPVWKAIAKTFSRLVEEVSGRLGDHRKTEARREKSARSLLSGDPNIRNIFWREEVITLLPGKRHIPLHAFLQKAHYAHKNTITVVEYGRDVPKGEAIAREGLIQVVHPVTLERFGCDSSTDFEEVLERARHNVAEDAQANGLPIPSHCGDDGLQLPQLVAFATLRDAFQERIQVVDESKVLDKETRRAWIALRWCLQHYAAACLGGKRYSSRRLNYDEERLQVLLGESNTCEAWTDGETYLAIEHQIVKRLKTDALKTAAYIFGLVEHEVAHQGDSMNCGHDEAFYQRYHDISIKMGPERQRFIHIWLMKYATSLESDGRKARSSALNERYLVDRVGSGRMKRGLTPVIEDLSTQALVMEPVPEQNLSLLALINGGLSQKGVCPEPPDWAQVVEQARLDQLTANERERTLREVEAADVEARNQAIEQDFEQAKTSIAAILGLEVSAIDPSGLTFLCECWVWEGQQGREEVLRAWEDRDWETPSYDVEDDYEYTYEHDIEQYQLILESEKAEERARNDPRPRLDEDCRSFVQDGETWWVLKRNTAAAGFWRVEEYLKWRQANQDTPDSYECAQ